MIKIVEVSGKKDLKKFAAFPLKLYKDCPYYVPSIWGDEINILNPKVNFNLKKCDAKCFLAYKDGKLVGRIAGIVHNEANRIWKRNAIRFSRLDAIDDLEVFEALINAVIAFGKEKGVDTIHGPWGFNDTDREGMLTYGFDRRSTYATNYSYPYYAENMKKLGFEDQSKWVEMNFVIPKTSSEKLERVAGKIKDKLKVKELSETMPLKKIIKEYGDAFFDTYNEAYSSLDGYVPATGEEKKNILKQFATIINPRYFSILINEKGEVAVAGVVLPSIAEALKKHGGKLFPLGFIDVLKSINKPNELEMAIICLKKEYKNSGINAIMMDRLMKNIIADGIEKIESNPMLETNSDILQNWKFAEHEIVKKRQTFVKSI